MNKKYAVSLELAKKMKELGFPQKSGFYWESIGDGIKSLKRVSSTLECKFNGDEISAYHVGELGEMLRTIELKGMKYTEKWDNLTKRANFFGEEYRQFGYNMADVFAQILIYLAENKLIDPTSQLHPGTVEPPKKSV